MRFTAAAHNAHAMPEELKKENFAKFKAAHEDQIHLQADNGLYLDIDGDGWAFWSGTSHSVFTRYTYKGDLYLVYAYGNKWTGNYLSYANNGYVGVYRWSASVAWGTSPLKVKGKSWRTYEYQKNGRIWVVIGNYDYTQRDLWEKAGL